MAASKKFTLNATDWQKIYKGSLIAGSGAVITYLLEALPSISFGEAWTPIVVALISILLNALRKLLVGR